MLAETVFTVLTVLNLPNVKLPCGSQTLKSSPGPQPSSLGSTNKHKILATSNQCVFACLDALACNGFAHTQTVIKDGNGNNRGLAFDYEAHTSTLHATT